MYEQRKASMVAMKMKRHNSFLGIAETRWIHAGQFRLSTGELILYSGHTHNGAPHTEGVGFLLSRHAEEAFIIWKPICSRLIRATYRTKQKRILVRLMGHKQGEGRRRLCQNYRPSLTDACVESLESTGLELSGTPTCWKPQGKHL